MTDTVANPSEVSPNPSHTNGGSKPWSVPLNGSTGPDHLLLPLATPVGRVQWPPPPIVSGCRAALTQLGATPGCLGITSSWPGEGRTTVATTSALILSRDYGHPTILVELDLERPTLATRMGIPSSPGVAELVRKETGLAEAIHVVDDQLGVVVAGKVNGPIAPLAAGTLTLGLLSHLRGRAHAVVADLPPLLSSEFATQFAESCDVVALVVRSSATAVSDVRRAAQNLREAPPVILNDIASSVPRWLARLTRV